ncbi:MAG: GDSL-type esterase/lipase family protein [Luteolibacter sp.]
MMCPAGAQTPLKVMPLGDSITYGFNGINYPNGSPPGGYRKQLGIRLAGAGISYDFVGNSNLNPAPGIDPDHNGYPGIRTDQALSALSGWLAVNPDVVLVHLGTNDMIQHVAIGTAIGNLSQIIQQITVNSPNRKLYVATIIPIIDTRDGHTPAEWKVIIDAYNDQVRSLVAQYANQGRKVFLTDMSAGLVYTFSDPSKNFFQPGDGTHPGQAGYNQMGDFWFGAIGGGTNPPPATGPQVLTNGSFESDFAGWSGSGNKMIQSSGAYTATDGIRLVAFNAGNSAPNGILAQTFSTTPGVTYALSFDAGVLAYTNSEQRLQVAVTGSGSLLLQTVSVSGSGNGTRWVRQNFSFVANSSATTLTFRDMSTTTNALDLLLDNVRVTGNGGGGGGTSNTAPTAAPDTHSTNKNTALVVPANGVLANDSDAQSQPLTAVLRSNPSNGSVSLSSNGGFTYNPANNFTGTDSFTYHAHDGSLSSNVVAVTINVNATSGGSTALVNGSFESGFNNWTISGNQELKSAAPYLATNGSKLVAFNGGNLAPNATLAQSFPTTAGSRYTLTFDAGVFSYNTNSQTLQVAITGSGSLLSGSVTLYGSGNGTNRWLPQSFTFVANSSTSILTFRDISSSSNSLDLLLDNVAVISTP